jgi:rhodanese-related sulfurtransferase
MRQNIFLLIALVFLGWPTRAQLPFKYDKTSSYKAVYIKEAFRLMDAMPDHLLLDVRSPGEYADTSAITALNIGRLKGSVNIPIDSMVSHLVELKKYADQPIFIYCSHSQRSRRVSKLLVENGFKNVYNINGGMTLLTTLNGNHFAYRNRIITPNLAYTNISSPDAWHLIKNTPNLVIIDIRSPDEFGSGDSSEQNNIGHLKNAINIPQGDFAGGKFDPKFPKDSPILLYDLYGYNSMDVVNSLRSKGYTRIYNLFEGLEGFISDYRLDEKAIAGSVTDPPPYKIIDPVTTIALLRQYPDLVILDTRSKDEFENHAEMGHANLGHIKGAVHVTTLQSLDTVVQNKPGSAGFLVYGSNSGFAATVCKELIKKGYRQVDLLSQGLYHLVWSVANVEDCEDGKGFLVDHEGLY